jgi:hypothetical protein
MISTPGAGMIEMKREFVVIPASDVDRAESLQDIDTAPQRIALRDLNDGSDPLTGNDAAKPYFLEDNMIIGAARFTLNHSINAQPAKQKEGEDRARRVNNFK